MRIFYAADSSPNPQLESNLWRNNLYQPLVDLGHEVVEFQYDRMRESLTYIWDTRLPLPEFVAENRPRLSAQLFEQIEAAHKAKPIDLFFSYFYDSCVLPETIDAIRRLGIVTVNWYCNGSYQLNLVEEISPHYDYCLVPEKFRLEDYRRLGANPIYCQEAANPNIYKPYAVEQIYDVAFIGQAYGDRPHYVKHLLDENINLRVWGRGWDAYTAENIRREKKERAGLLARQMLTGEGWRRAAGRVKKRFADKAQKSETDKQLGLLSLRPFALPGEILGGALSDEEMIKMYSRAKINLGFSSCGETHATANRILQVRLRDFEVPMAGGFYMVEYMEELAEFFRIGEEIVCYRDKEDLADKIRFYLAHDTERERIRRRGYERAQRDHTWHKRFRDSFAQINLKESQPQATG